MFCISIDMLRCKFRSTANYVVPAIELILPSSYCTESPTMINNKTLGYEVTDES